MFALLLLLAGPCDGRVQDKAPHRLESVAKPAPGQTYTDPAFKTRITRITAANRSEGEGAVIKPLYSTMPAWNADESLLMLWHREKGHELYDGQTYAKLRSLSFESPTDIEQVLWDPIQPNVVWYPSNLNARPRLMSQYVGQKATGPAKVLRDFGTAPTECPVGDWSRLLKLGSDPQWMGWGPRRIVGLQCGETSFLYSITENKVLEPVARKIRAPVAPIVGPGEKLVQWLGNVYDLGFRKLRRLPLSNPYEHASIGRAAGGYDTWNSVVFDGAPVGSLVSYRLDTGAAKVIIGPSTGYPYPPSATHVSAVAQKAPGWVAVGIVGDHHGRTPLDNEIVLANIDTGQVCRVAHARTFAGTTSVSRWGYWSESHVVISPTGTRVLWGSDWMNGDTVDTYVADLRK